MKENIKRIRKRIITMLTVLTVTVTAVCAAVPVSAASFSSGKGTKKSPYIITTADQLNAMRENLSAYYKLGANIDLNGRDWKAVGTYKKAFTGGLTCDTDKDGKPIYAITNLKCKVAPPNYDSPDYRYDDYKADGSSGWEAGLFGVLNKAEISNIVILNATVENWCRGRSQQETYKGQVVNNPVYQMCAGIMAGTAIASNINNCGVTGAINGNSNGVGGFVGRIAGKNTIKQCYAMVDIKNSGYWGTGGFVGMHVESVDEKLQSNTSGVTTISECYASGNIKGGYCGTGGFSGNLNSKIAKLSDCYSEGYVKGDALTYSFFGEESRTNVGETLKTCTNCYTTAGNNDKSKPGALKGKAVNCFISTVASANGTYPVQDGFTAADQATINAAFKDNAAWTVTDGTYPKLKSTLSIRTLEDLGKVVAAATDGNKPTESNNASDTDNTTSGDVDNNQGVVTDENTGDGDASYKLDTVVYDNTKKMTKMETVLVIVLLILIVTTLAGSVWTVILMLKYLKSNGAISAKRDKIHQKTKL